MPRNLRNRVLRSVMRSGGSLVVSLPKRWAESVKIGDGDYVVVEVAGSSLIISPTSVENESEVRLRFSSDLASLIDKVVAAYLMGYDSISIAYPTEVKEALERELFFLKDKLMGLEIVESGQSSMRLRMVIDPLELKPVQVLRRMWKLSDDMLRYSLKSAAGEVPEPLGFIEKAEDDVDRLYFYMVRVLRKSSANPALAALLGLTSVEILDYRLAAYFLENIADRIFEIAGLTRENISSFDVEGLSKILLENHELSMDAFLNKRIDVLPRIKRNSETLVKLLTPPRLRGGQVKVRDALISIADMQYDIASLALPQLA